MLAISLQSGSNGNSIYVEGGGVRILIDAGISGVKAQTGLASCDRDIRRVDAVLLSHDHIDHIKCAGVYQRKFHLPIYATRKTMSAAMSKGLGQLSDVRSFVAGDMIDFGAMQVHTIRTPHDGVDGVAFVVQCDSRRIGVLTDLGYPFPGLAETVSSCDGVFIESNYDPQMLREGPYPIFLQRRVAGNGGHLSNMQCADLLKLAGGNLRWACLAHLSEKNNTPSLALQASERCLKRPISLHVASRYVPMPALEV